VTLVLQGTDSDFVSEAPVGIVGGASWRILAWSAWGLTVTNVLAPSGGRIGWLDELGSERALSRAPGEDDATYRQRIKSIADVVTPNAIRRTLSRTLGTFPWCFREVGTEYLPGFFYDGDLSIPGFVAHGPLNDAYDVDAMLLAGGSLTGPVLTLRYDAPYIWAVLAGTPGSLVRHNSATGEELTFPLPSAIPGPNPILRPSLAFDATHVFLTTGSDQYAYIFDKTLLAIVGICDCGPIRLSCGIARSLSGGPDVMVTTSDGDAPDTLVLKFSKVSVLAGYPAAVVCVSSVDVLSTPIATDLFLDIQRGAFPDTWVVSGATAAGNPRLFLFNSSTMTFSGFYWNGGSLLGFPIEIIATNTYVVAVLSGGFTSSNVRKFSTTLAQTGVVSTTSVSPRCIGYDSAHGEFYVDDESTPGRVVRISGGTFLQDGEIVLSAAYALKSLAVETPANVLWASRDLAVSSGTDRFSTFPTVESLRFAFQEPVEVEDRYSGDNYATGYFGIGGDTSVTLIRTSGALPNPLPPNVIARGTISGTVFNVSSETFNPTRSSRRFHVYLDYSQFRGFFLVCLPPLGLGEFGFAYGDHPANAYDAPAPYETFLDGYPYLNSLVYGRVYQAIDQVRAGGVLFDLCLDDGSCP
jgi:hypothetical protein